MEIKELFDKAEGGTLTYEQFTEAAGKSKFVDVSTGDYVSVNKHNDEVEKLNKQIETLNGTIKTRDSDLKELQGKLKEAGADADKLSALSGDLANLQQQYDTDTKNYKAMLEKQAYEFAVKEFANGYEFSSKAAKKDFVREMIGAELKMDDKGIVGGTDFYKRYAADNADAFVTKTATPEAEPAAPDNKPQFASSTGDNQPKAHKKSLMDIMKAKNDNPNMGISFD